MEICFVKGGPEDRVLVRRKDGSVLEAVLPPHCVYHDVAHWVVERALGTAEGFWGRIAEGYSLADYALPEEERPFPLTQAAYASEFLATIVQSAVPAGRVSMDYVEMLRSAVSGQGLPFPELPDAAWLNRCVTETGRLHAEWEGLSEGGQMVLAWIQPSQGT